MLIKVNSHSKRWLFTTVYASPTLSKSLKFLEFLIELANTYQLPWLMMGDFNELLESTDKIGGRDLIPSRVQAFDNCLKRCGFFELASSGPNCTWTNKSWNWSKHIKEKLDKAFCNNE